MLTRQVGRSREGAWIEMLLSTATELLTPVAPVRERGLKLLGKRRIHKLRLVAPVRERGLKLPLCRTILSICSRSREGAWIEIEDIFKLGFVTIKSLP